MYGPKVLFASQRQVGGGGGETDRPGEKKDVTSLLPAPVIMNYASISYFLFFSDPL